MSDMDTLPYKSLNIVPLASSPVLTVSYDTFIEEDEKDFFREYNSYMRPRPDGALISDTYTLFDSPRLKSLKVKFDQAIKQYVNTVLCAPQLQFKLSGSWFTKNTYNTSHHDHFHRNSMLSAVTYFDDEVPVDEHISGIVFSQPRFLSIFPHFKFDFSGTEISEWNIYNYATYTIRPKVNDVIIFPSYMSHSTEPNTTESRFCIGTNYFISGAVRGNTKHTALNLNVVE